MLYHVLWLAIYLVIRLFLALCGGLRVAGRENVPRTGGLIIAPNHLSHADPAIIGVTVPRFPYYVATDELFTIPFFGTIARWMRSFPIRQDSPDRAALRRTEALLKQGEAVVIFPEGHESLDGRVQELQGGTILLALRAGVPVVPVGILGTESLVPPRTFRIRRPSRRIEVRYGMPISPEELAGEHKGRTAVDHGTEALRKALLDLTDQADIEPEDVAETTTLAGVGEVCEERAG
jgi:1-acyl-sn-glycerol-3-phosphate acyltransferase